MRKDPHQAVLEGLKATLEANGLESGFIEPIIKKTGAAIDALKAKSGDNHVLTSISYMLVLAYIARDPALDAMLDGNAKALSDRALEYSALAITALATVSKEENEENGTSIPVDASTEHTMKLMELAIKKGRSRRG